VFGVGSGGGGGGGGGECEQRAVVCVSHPPGAEHAEQRAPRWPARRVQGPPAHLPRGHPGHGGTTTTVVVVVIIVVVVVVVVVVAASHERRAQRRSGGPAGKAAGGGAGAPNVSSCICKPRSPCLSRSAKPQRENRVFVAILRQPL